MDVHLDALEGQEKARDSSKESSSTEAQQDAAMKTNSSETMDVESVSSSFASSARAGHRNAEPNIQGLPAVARASDLPLKLEAMTVKKGAKEKNENAQQDQLTSPPNKEK